ncbi:DELLA RGL1-like [Olea europaea subsp. europaea]|uniref:DELLA RGL1-like n=1 Tax=Olea europaea subsp. europaea TaxID=158383 RepID=A0A8S0PUJ3_OLEEU|nr:DELLA RGL1-like [Olea europaea subsp. europaea]
MEALHYYSAILDSPDAMLPKYDTKRAKMEQYYFVEEIKNIVSYEGLGRMEKHERVDQWRRRISQAGFQPAQLKMFAQAKQWLNNGIACEGYTIVEKKGCLVLGWKSKLIVTAFLLEMLKIISFSKLYVGLNREGLESRRDERHERSSGKFHEQKDQVAVELILSVQFVNLRILGQILAMPNIIIIRCGNAYVMMPNQIKVLLEAMQMRLVASKAAAEALEEATATVLIVRSLSYEDVAGTYKSCLLDREQEKPLLINQANIRLSLLQVVLAILIYS